MLRFPSRCLALASLLLLSAPDAASDVLVVEVGQGASFSGPQVAIDAASDGDTILIKAGGFGGFTIDGKALSVLADTGTTVPISGRIVIRNLTPSQRVHLAGLVVVGLATGANCSSSPDDSGVALLVENTGGAVRITNCSFRGADAGSALCNVVNFYQKRENGYDAVRLTDARDVAFDNCDAFGGEGLFLSGKVLHHSGDGGHGVNALDSLVAFHHSVLRGGRGGSADLGGMGGIAYWARGLGGLVSGCTLIGGDSGFSTDTSYAPPLAGGDAIRTDFGSMPAEGVQVQHLESTLQGGAGNMSSATPYVGDQGMSFGGPGLEVEFTGTAPELDSPTLVRENSTLSLSLRGEPGHQAVLIQSRRTLFRPLAGLRGVQLVGQGANATALETRWLFQGVIPPSGSLQVTLPVGDQGPGFESTLWRYQLLTYLPAMPASTAALGDFAEITILDDSL